MQPIPRSMAQAKTSLEVEGFLLTPIHDALVYSVLSGELTEEEFFAKVAEIVFNKDS